MLFTENKGMRNFKKAFLNPGVISVILGLIIFIFSISLPFPIMKTVESIGSMTTPISMMVVGSMLADIKFKELFSGSAIFYGAFIRLIFLPVAILLILRLIGIEKILMDVAVILVAMPAAVNTVVFSENNNGDSVLASKIVFLTTMLSILTIPLILLVI
jgi:predicted permease